MVLSKSDYSVPKPGETMDPTDPTGFVSRLAGLVVVLSVIAFAFNFATNRGVSFINKYAGRVGLSSSGQENSPWGGW